MPAAPGRDGCSREPESRALRPGSQGPDSPVLRWWRAFVPGAPVGATRAAIADRAMADSHALIPARPGVRAGVPARTDRFAHIARLAMELRWFTTISWWARVPPGVS